ncbi:MAG: hypothetical protein HW404_1056 [Anaerolineales bacterium]|nr:hypothetical protein [Anaerolineales bacterium]
MTRSVEVIRSGSRIAGMMLGRVKPFLAEVCENPGAARPGTPRRR